MTRADTKVFDGLTRYGEYLGLAFQIADDILDFTGDAVTLGKPVGHDLREGKITLPLIRSLAAAGPEERETIIGLLGKPDAGESDWQLIFDFVERHGGVAAASATAHEFAGKALKCLEVVEPSVARSILETAVRLVVERDN